MDDRFREERLSGAPVHSLAPDGRAVGLRPGSVMAVHGGPSTKWLFTREQLENTPSRRCGIDADRELSYRQQAADLIQHVGQRLNVPQLIINSAIVYMHRFYMIHSFNKYHRNIISQTTLFLAAKVEQQPRKVKHIITTAHACLNPQQPALDTNSNAFWQQAHELIAMESIVLQTLRYGVTVDHSHTYVVRCSQLVRASQDLSRTSYFIATNSLHLTTFCLQYRPTVVACVCIHLTSKWLNWKIPVSTDGKHWWEYVDRTVTLQLLDELTHELLQILEKTPSWPKRIRDWRAIQAAKKRKTEGETVDSAFQGTSLKSLPGVTNSFFPSTSASDSTDMPSLNSIGDQSKSCGVNAAAFSRPGKVLTLEQYRERRAAELALQNGVTEEPGTDMYTPAAALSSHHHHKRPSQQAGQAADGRQDEPSSKKARLPPSFAENGSASSEELKMRIKVSSERHGGSEHGGTVSGKYKHQEHGNHRHSEHTDSHSHALSGNRGTIGHCNDGASSGLSRKRPHSDAGGHNHHHHHPSKSSRSSKAGLGLSHYASDGGQRMMEHHGHNGTNGQTH